MAPLTGQAQNDSAAERLAAIQSRLSAIEQRSDRVDDLNTIENLQRTFGFYVDKMLWEQVLDLLTEDATFELRTDGAEQASRLTCKWSAESGVDNWQ